MNNFIELNSNDLMRFIRREFMQPSVDTFFPKTAELHEFYKHLRIANYTRSIFTLENERIIRAQVGEYASTEPIYNNSFSSHVIREFTNKLKEVVGDPSLGDYFYTDETPDSLLLKLNPDNEDQDISATYDSLYDLDLLKRVSSMLRKSNLSETLDEFYQNVFLGEALLLDKDGKFENINIGEFACYNDIGGDVELILVPNTTISEIKEKLLFDSDFKRSGSQVMWTSFSLYVHQNNKIRHLVFTRNKNLMNTSKEVYTATTDEMLEEKVAYYYRYDGCSDVFPRKSLASMVHQEVLTVCEHERFRSKSSKLELTQLLAVRSAFEAGLQFGNEPVTGQPSIPSIRSRAGNSSEFLNKSDFVGKKPSKLNLESADNELGVSYIMTQNPSTDVVPIPKNSEYQLTEALLMESKFRIDRLLGIELSPNDSVEGSATESLQNDRKSVMALSSISSKLRRCMMTLILKKYIKKVIPKEMKYSKVIGQIYGDGIRYSVGAEALANGEQLQDCATFIEFLTNILQQDAPKVVDIDSLLKHIATKTNIGAEMINEKGIIAIQKNYDIQSESMDMQSRQADIQMKQADAGLKQAQASNPSYGNQPQSSAGTQNNSTAP